MSISAGPFALSLNVFWLMLAFVVALLVGWLAGRKRQVSIEPVLSNMLLVGVVAARLGFVVMYLPDYLAQPVSIIDIRDGGFFYPAGIAAATVLGALYAWRRSALRAPLGIAVLTGAAVWAATAGGSAMIRASQPTLPSLTLMAMDGSPAPLAKFKGRPVVVNLWATWCPPCRREMPVLAKAQQTEKEVVFVFINQGEHDHVVSGYLTSEQLKLDNVLLDYQSSTMRKLGANGLPSTYFFNTDGQLVDSHFGALSTATLKANLKSLKD